MENSYYEFRGENLNVYENPTEKCLQEIKEILKKINYPLKITIAFSALSKNKIDKIIPHLAEIDEIAFEKGFPVTLSICQCCVSELRELISLQRWKSRWETH